jgi:hypothetical protein
MLTGLRAIPVLSAPQGAIGARRDLWVRRMATCLTVVTAAIAVVIVAAVAVVFSIT